MGIDLSKPYNGILYVVKLKVELRNHKKGWESMNYPPNSPKLYVERPTAVGTCEIVSRFNDLDSIRNQPEYKDRIGRKIAKNYKSDMKLDIVEVVDWIATNHPFSYKQTFKTRKEYERNRDGKD